MTDSALRTPHSALKRSFHRIEVSVFPHLTDARGAAILRDLEEDLNIRLSDIRVVELYDIYIALTAEDAGLIAKNLLTDPIIQHSAVDMSIADSYQCDFLVKVSYKPGVTDNAGMTTKEAISMMLDKPLDEKETVHAGSLYLLKGCDRKTAEHVAADFLANGVIEDFEIHTPETWKQAKQASPFQPPPSQGRVNFADLNVDDKQLIEISKKGLLSLSLSEMLAIKEYFFQDDVVKDRMVMGLPLMPSDVELETLAQTWSEHCKHKIFSAHIHYRENGKKEFLPGLFSTFIKRATDNIKSKQDQLLSVFSDNAGVVRLDDDYGVVFKVETHNHPSALDPYGGALTGIVGVNRDPLGTGLGAQLIFNTDIFCFGLPDFPEKKLPSGVLHPRRIFRGVRKGVEHGGNKIGIPTVNGAIVFDQDYLANPLVFCGTGGLLPTKINGISGCAKEVRSGDLVVMVGGRIGKDGLHGATFSSASLEEEIPPMVVQIGAPIVQKKMMDALLEARDKQLYRCITDNGAGGLSSSIGEMARLSGGCRIDLDKAPVKYPGLDPWELWVSEAQERMTLAVPMDKVEAFMELMKSREVEATVLGEFNDSGKVHLLYEGKTVGYLNLHFLHEGLPPMELQAQWREPDETDPSIKTSGDFGESLKKILAHPTVASKEWVIRQYDHEVQGRSVVKPLVGQRNDGPSDAAVIKPLYDREYGVAIACGINPNYSAIDTYWMAALAVDECLRNLVAVGADPDRVYILDNFCWGNPVPGPDNPDGEFKLAQLVRAAKACYDMSIGYGAPFISGKDSFYNEFRWEGESKAIPPTLLISGVGMMDDCGQAVTMDAKAPGDLIYLLGETLGELGGSFYYSVNGWTGGKVPRVDAERQLSYYRQLHKATRKGLIRSCHDLSEGGVALSLAETAFAGGLGMEVDLKNMTGDLPDHALLFSESSGRFVITVQPEKREGFEELLKEYPLALLGIVNDGNRLVIKRDDRMLIDEDIDVLKKVWQEPLKW